jgi:stress-induced morphogen
LGYDIGRSAVHVEKEDVMPMPAEELEARLRAAFPDGEIVLTDLAGDGDHYKARIVSPQFSGLTRVRQHQLVNKALADVLGGRLHALALETAAP